MGLSSLEVRRRSCMTFFGPSMTGKTVVINEGEENFGEFPVMVGGRGLSDAHFSRTRTRVCVRRWL